MPRILCAAKAAFKDGKAARYFSLAFGGVVLKKKEKKGKQCSLQPQEREEKGGAFREARAETPDLAPVSLWERRGKKKK